MNSFIGFDEAVVIDVETTGINPEKDRVVEVAVIRGNFRDACKGSAKFDTWQAKINPGIPIPADATRIHGISNSDVKSEKTFAEVAKELREFIGNRNLIGHNVQFDKKFLNAEFKRSGERTLHRNKSHCTMWRFREDFPRMSKSLDSAASVLGISRSGNTHSAMEDAGIAMDLAAQFYAKDNNISIGKPLALDEAKKIRNRPQRPGPGRSQPLPKESFAPQKSKGPSLTYLLLGGLVLVGTCAWIAG